MSNYLPQSALSYVQHLLREICLAADTVPTTSPQADANLSQHSSYRHGTDDNAVRDESSAPSIAHDTKEPMAANRKHAQDGKVSSDIEKLADELQSDDSAGHRELTASDAVTWDWRVKRLYQQQQALKRSKPFASRPS